ncbi:hypothetical protein ACFY1U_49130 [Streptomyces sp. NPDC001351]|uniref:hypothetical protein n=1 Tax=Streptomyces sp. NPDC001351 TaxID=3364564 RepID=UPI00369746F8
MPDGGGHRTLGRRAGRATRGGMGFGEASEAAAGRPPRLIGTLAAPGEEARWPRSALIHGSPH